MRLVPILVDSAAVALRPLSRLRFSFNRLVYMSCLVATCFYFVKFDPSSWTVDFVTKFNLKDFELFVR